MKIELSSGEYEFPDNLRPDDVRKIRDKIVIKGNNEMTNLGSVMYEIVKATVKKVNGLRLSELELEDQDKIASEYLEEIKGFQSQ